MTIELTTGVDRPPDRLDYCTKVTAVSPAPEGTPCPMWTTFMHTVTGGDGELTVGFLKRSSSATALTGFVNEHPRWCSCSAPAATAKPYSCRL